MRCLRLIPFGAVLAALSLLSLSASDAMAGQNLGAVMMPVLLAKSWLVGYALVFLAILLGLLAVLLPSMRKVLRKRDM